MGHVAVFGIGSTNFRYAVASPDGEFQGGVRLEPTRPRDLPAQLVDAVDKLRSATPGSIDVVAVSCAGLVDATAGEVRSLDTPSGDTVDRVDLETPVDRAHGLPVYVENDCNASALGEWYYGAGADHDCVAHVTFGTGIGGGVVERGRLLRGDAGQAGEFGLLPIVPRAHSSTGVAGAWEAVCSGRGIPRYLVRRIDGDDGAVGADGDDGAADGRTRFADADGVTAEDVFDAAAAGEAVAQECLAEVAEYNAAGIAAVANAFNPGLVTLGGGVATNNPDWMVEGIERSIDRYLFVDRPTVRLSPLGDDVGLYGALATYLDRSPDATPGDASRIGRGESG